MFFTEVGKLVRQRWGIVLEAHYLERGWRMFQNPLSSFIGRHIVRDPCCIIVRLLQYVSERNQFAMRVGCAFLVIGC